MSVTPITTSVAAVTQMNAGADIQRRRLAIGRSVASLAKKAGVDRGRLAALEAGAKVRDTTLAAVLKALEEEEHELGMDMPSQVAGVGPAQPERAAPAKPAVIRVEVQGVYGAKALVFEAPPENMSELVEMVDAVMRRLAQEQGDTNA